MSLTKVHLVLLNQAISVHAREFVGDSDWFYVGATSDWDGRWLEHQGEGYERRRLLAQLETLSEVQFLEERLISSAKRWGGRCCRNDADDSRGLQPNQAPYYVYVIAKSPPRIVVRMRKERRAD